MLQSIAGLISLVLTVIVIAVAIFVTRRSRTHKADGYATVYRARPYYAAGLMGALAILLLVTLAKTPYRRSASEAPALTIDAAAWMWGWEFQVDGVRAASPLVLPVGELVEFAVSARDVNHGFGIYDPQGRLVAQTQAMPGYVNRLRVRFEERGTYQVLCLEYCGLGHSVMITRFTVE